MTKSETQAFRCGMLLALYVLDSLGQDTIYEEIVDLEGAKNLILAASEIDLKHLLKRYTKAGTLRVR